SGRWATAGETYRLIPAWLIELERSEEARQVPKREQELEMVTYVVVARSLQPPMDGLRMANEVMGLEEHPLDLFTRPNGYPSPMDLSRRLSRLNSAQIDALMRACAFPRQKPPVPSFPLGTGYSLCTGKLVRVNFIPKNMRAGVSQSQLSPPC